MPIKKILLVFGTILLILFFVLGKIISQQYLMTPPAHESEKEILAEMTDDFERLSLHPVGEMPSSDSYDQLIADAPNIPTKTAAVLLKAESLYQSSNVKEAVSLLGDLYVKVDEDKSRGLILTKLLHFILNSESPDALNIVKAHKAFSIFLDEGADENFVKSLALAADKYYQTPFTKIHLATLLQQELFRGVGAVETKMTAELLVSLVLESRTIENESPANIYSEHDRMVFAINRGMLLSTATQFLGTPAFVYSDEFEYAIELGKQSNDLYLRNQMLIAQMFYIYALIQHNDNYQAILAQLIVNLKDERDSVLIREYIRIGATDNNSIKHLIVSTLSKVSPEFKIFADSVSSSDR